MEKDSKGVTSEKNQVMMEKLVLKRIILTRMVLPLLNTTLRG